MPNLFDTIMPTSKTPTFIFIDGSYFNFYRYHALLQWWKISNAEQPPLEDPYLNAEFVNKFKKTHVEHLQQIPKKLKLQKDALPIMIVGKDCKREDIWRMKHYPNYKGTRDNGKGDFKGAPFFKMVYAENLFLEGGAKAILKHPHLEADDCIALSVKYLLKKYGSMCEIYIIASDHDYLQLCGPNVHLYNLAYKNMPATKEDLQLKILTGDKSDNIPAVFPKCGPKTAQKYIEDDELFRKKLQEEPAYLAQYQLNQLLVDFDNIPEDLSAEFIQNL